MNATPLEEALRRASTAVVAVLEQRGMPGPMAQVNATLVAFGLLVGDDASVRAVAPGSLVPEQGDRPCFAFARLLLSGLDQKRTQMALAVAEAAAMAEPAEAEILLRKFSELSRLTGEDVAVLIAADPEAITDPAWQRRGACIDQSTRARSAKRLEELGLFQRGALTPAGLALLVLASWHPEIL